MIGRQKIAMVVAEFLGTAILAIAVYSMVARTTFPLFGGLAAGVVAGLATITFNTISWAHINPALTLGLWTARKIKTVPAIFAIAAQMLGGLLAWALLKYFLGHSLTSMATGKFAWKVLIAEAVGTFVFVFGVTSAVYHKLEGSLLAFAVGGSLTIGILVASMASNGVVNPAVALGIQSWSWAYAVGPLVGGIVGANLYALLFAGDFPVVVSSVSSSRTITTSAKAPAKKRPAAKRTTTRRRR